MIASGFGCKAIRLARETTDSTALRPMVAWMLVKYSGLTHRQVADTLGMKSGVSASLQVRKAMTLKEGDRKTKKLVAAIEEALEGQISGVRPA